ncbi:beta-lactamase-like protein, partial [Dunaliella salina]
GKEGVAGASAVTITPYNAGHLLGGCVWRIVAGFADGRGGGQAGSGSEEEVVYAVDWCHKKERHLASCALVDLFSSRPALMITDAMDALTPSVDSTSRDIELLDVIMATLRGSDGSVLIPCDASGRVLEVALLLDAFWAREKLDRVYPLIMLSDVSKAVADAAQSQLEFMSDSVGKAFEMRRDNPFNFRCIRLLSSVDQLAHLQAGPKV